MYKIISLLVSFFILFAVHGQEDAKKATNMLKPNVVIDSVKNVLAAADTTKKESRRERRRREKAEEEAKIPKIFKDSTRLAVEARTTSAWKRSAMVPGWGQYSNEGLWWLKVPVIYGGFVSTVLAFDFNNRYYNELIEELAYRTDFGEVRDNEYRFVNEQALINAKDYARRNRDLMVLLTIGIYGLNVVEAYVDSMLKYRWSVNTSQLGFSIRPTLLGAPSPQFASHSMPTMGLKLTMQLK